MAKKKEVLPIIHGAIVRDISNSWLGSEDSCPCAKTLKEDFEHTEKIIKDKEEQIKQLNKEINLIRQTQPNLAMRIRNEYPFVEYLSNCCADRLTKLWKTAKRDPFELVLDDSTQIIYDSIVDAFFGDRPVTCIDILACCDEIYGTEFRFKDNATSKIITVTIPQHEFNIQNYRCAGKFQVRYTEDNIRYCWLIFSFDADECKEAILKYLNGGGN